MKRRTKSDHFSHDEFIGWAIFLRLPPSCFPNFAEHSMGACIRFSKPRDPSGGGLPRELAHFCDGKPSTYADNAFGEIFDAMMHEAKKSGLSLGYSDDGVIKQSQYAIHFIKATMFAMETTMNATEAIAACTTILQASAQGLANWLGRAAPNSESSIPTLEIFSLPVGSSLHDDFTHFAKTAGYTLGSWKERDALEGSALWPCIPAKKKPPRI